MNQEFSSMSWDHGMHFEIFDLIVVMYYGGPKTVVFS